MAPVYADEAGFAAQQPARARLLLTLAISIFLLRGALAIAVVPPWQHPDEPQHFALVHVLARQTRLDLTDRRDLDLERRILISMAAHGWWRHYGEALPHPLPTDFGQVPEHISTTSTMPPVYYILGARVLKLSGVEDLVAQAYVLRWMALAIAVPILLCIWAGTRRLFGSWVAGGATLLTALHPQFVLFSTAVNPAVLVNLCGAVFWWQGARLVTGRPALVSLAILTGTAAVGVFTKRVAAPLVPMLLVIPMIAWGSGRLGTWRATRPAVVGAAGGLALAAVGGVIWFDGEVGRLTDYWSYALTLVWAERARDWTFFQDFSAGLFNSAWLRAGWLRYPAPAAWLTLIRLVVVAALVGWLVGLWRQEMAAWRMGFILAAALLAIQTAGVYVGIYMNGYGPQGHYLFPVFGPFMAMLWVGLHQCFPRRHRAYVTVSVVAFFAAFDLVGWTHVIVPAFLG